MLDAGQIAQALAGLGFPGVEVVVGGDGTPRLRVPDNATQAALDALDLSDAAEALRQVARNRADAVAAFLASTVLGQALRAEALVLVDEINALRGWITSFKAAVATATTLADLKTRVAALASMPDRTAAQAKAAITAKAADSASDA